MSFQLRLIGSTSDFHALEEEWNKLYDRCEKCTIFSSWDWMYTWWDVFKDQLNTKLTLLCFYNNNRLIGIAPFQIVSSFPKSLVQGNTLCFLGSGEVKNDQIVSQFLDFIVEPGMETKMTDAVSNYLVDNKSKWHFADFEFLLKDSLISQCFRSDKSGIHRKEVEYGVRFSVPEMVNFEYYKSQMGKRWKKMYLKKSRILSKDGAVKVTTIDTFESINPAFNLLAEMHEARWKNRTKRSIFKSPHFCNFHLKVMKRLLPKDKVFIKTLYLDDEALASYYCFTDKSHIHYYQSGFYTEHANRYSPLFLLVCDEIGKAIKSKKTFDFMFSDQPDSYKKEQYAAEHTTMYRLRWSPYRFRFVIFHCAKMIQNIFLKMVETINNKKRKA